MNAVKANLEALRQRISSAALKSNRKPEDIKLIAVTKTIPVDLIEEAIEFGVREFGENRVQEAEAKIRALKPKYPEVAWHMLGHLQTNKVGQALDIFDIIQTVDSERLAEEISKRAGKPVPVLIEVNTSGEASKFGIELGKAIGLVRFAASLDKIKVQGLMTVGPLVDDPEAARPSFRQLRELRDKIIALNLPSVEMRFLSMGMTDDFETAIEEGSNMIRIGRALFGERS